MNEHADAPSISRWPSGLSGRDVGALVALGIALWFIAAMTCKLVASYGLYEGSGMLLLYILVIPGIAPFVWVSLKLTKIRRDQYFAGVAVMTMAAMLFDGIALTWLPVLYGSAVTDTAAAGAIILWGAAWGLVWGVVLDKNPGQ